MKDKSKKILIANLIIWNIIFIFLNILAFRILPEAKCRTHSEWCYSPYN